MEYLSDVELARRFAVSRVTIWRWSSQGILPKPVKLGANCSRWRAEEIAAAEDRWLAAREKRFGETPHDAAPAPVGSPEEPRKKRKRAADATKKGRAKPKVAHVAQEGPRQEQVEG